jgi:hypothetical protein
MRTRMLEAGGRDDVIEALVMRVAAVIPGSTRDDYWRRSAWSRLQQRVRYGLRSGAV